MCLEVFVASDEPRPLVLFDAGAPAFSVGALWPKAEPVRGHFSKPYVYSLGAQTGCACGFRYSASDLDESLLNNPDVPEFIKDSERADHDARREAVRQLRRFLLASASRSGSLRYLLAGSATKPQSHCHGVWSRSITSAEPHFTSSRRSF